MTGASLNLGFAYQIIGGVCVLLASLLTLFQIRHHMRFNPRPSFRLYVTRLLFMVPIYGLTSFLGLRFPSASVYFDTTRDCYEAFVIYSFLSLIVCCIRFRPPNASSPQEKLFQRAQLGTLQYVFVKPTLSLFSLLLAASGVFHNGEISFRAGYTYVTILNNISQIWAMYCLVQVYHHYHEDLAPMRPFCKFVAVKGLVFVTYWQSVTIAILVSLGALQDTNGQELALEDFLICMEMLGFALYHHYAFKPEDFWFTDQDPESRNVTQPLFEGLWSAVNLSDVLNDVRTDVFRHSRRDTARLLGRPMTTTARTFTAKHQRSRERREEDREVEGYEPPPPPNGREHEMM